MLCYNTNTKMKLFLSLLLLISVLFLFPIKSFAQSSAATPSATTIDYSLPYPGILPDNPLYFMKALRDRIISIFISDPLKKAEFNLLMSDVRLNAAIYLFAKGEGKYSLAETTVSKAENYFYNALVKLSEAKQQGMGINDLTAKLITASKKHQQLIRELENKTTGSIRGGLMDEEERAKSFEKKAILFKSN